MIVDKGHCCCGITRLWKQHFTSPVYWERGDYLIWYRRLWRKLFSFMKNGETDGLLAGAIPVKEDIQPWELKLFYSFIICWCKKPDRSKHNICLKKQRMSHFWWWFCDCVCLWSVDMVTHDLAFIDDALCYVIYCPFPCEDCKSRHRNERNDSVGWGKLLAFRACVRPQTKRGVRGWR